MNKEEKKIIQMHFFDEVETLCFKYYWYDEKHNKISELRKLIKELQKLENKIVSLGKNGKN